MGRRPPAASPWPLLVLLCCIAGGRVLVAGGSFSFEDTFELSCADDHFKTSPDVQTWHLYLDKDAGCGFQTKHRYRFGWFGMKMKLVGGDSAGVVTAFYMCSDKGAAPDRDEVDIEFLGNRSGQPYIIQTNVYKGGVGNREMRHSLWFDPTADFHTYSFLWNTHHLVFFVDKVAIRVFKNGEGGETYFPSDKPMYLFSSIWNADDWATRGGLEKTDWTQSPFISSYKDFAADACQWEDPFPSCVATTTEHWWDQYPAWSLSAAQAQDAAWVRRNLVVYDYCTDLQRFPSMPPECSLRDEQ